ncbi:MAG: asparagine synthase (glutamine-hydrolyzing) [Pseudohongiella sp.]|nr:asparagine synthase (glutamine-hydrolyzing) [Pseudohongiella sp.]
MCGIAGIVGVSGQPVYHGEIKAMCDAILHRGPDDDGYFVDGPAGLGMRRLSIIDVNSGHQPAWNETNDICVVLNGEIYNYRELRLELMSKGHIFKSGSDTEVIVHLYEEMGEDCLHQLRGMFAFAIWDKTKQILLLARDRLGIKPLYYAEANGRLLFASEMKALLQLPDIKKELNWESVNYLFSFLSTPGDESILKGVHKLQPGHYLRVCQGKPVENIQYWDVQFTPDTIRSEQDTVGILREKLQEAVRYCMVSDVPVGAFLSGGLDSSSVVAMMSREQRAPVKTFSIGFPEPAYDETAYARQVASVMGSEHHELMLDADVAGQMQKLAWFLDEPFGDSSAIPTYMVSQLASGHVKVILSGDGGDEIFAGYDKYMVERKERSRDAIPQPLRKMIGAFAEHLPEGTKGRNYLRHLALSGKHRYLDASSLFGVSQKSSLFTADFSRQIRATDSWCRASELLANSGDSHWLSSLQYHDLKTYLPLDILTKVDRMSMANSIEVRVPLLDHKLVEFAATIPADMKIKQGRTKHIFKEAMRGILPDELIDRRKQGFAVPLGHWFRGQLNSFVRELLLSERSLSRGIFNASYIEKIIALHDRGRPMDQHLWVLISFELWCQNFMDKDLVSRAAVEHVAKNAAQKPRNNILSCPEILYSYSVGR